jgi:hypothetical protein
MKRLKLFESYSREEWQKQVMESTGMLDILYDLKEASLEYLDVRHYQDNRFRDEDDPEGDLVDKKIVYMVDLHDKDVLYLGNLCGGEYSYENPDIEESLYWSDDITAPAEEIAKGFKEGQLSLNITFCIVVGETGDLRTINDDTSKVLSRISDMHPEAEFDTFNPWDLN